MMKKITLLLCLTSFYVLSAQDNCASALPITPGTYTVATVNGPQVPIPVCTGGATATAGEWYSFTATADGVATISTNLPQNAGRDTRVHIYSGSCGALTCVGGHDDISINPDNFLSIVNWVVSNGTTYYIAFDNRWESTGFDFELTEVIADCDFSLPYSEDFSNIANLPICWENIDDDGDGLSWFTVDYDLDNNGIADGNPTLVSESWRTAPLTPDNWLISGAIDLTNAGGTITLTWKARGIDPNFPDENYTVYAATANTIPDFLVSPVSFNEIIGQNGGAGTTFVDRSLDISSFAGQTIYVAFRHHDVTDQFVLNIDDVAVQATLSNTEFTKGVTHYYQKNTETLVLQHTKTIDKVLLYTLLGQEIFPKTVQEGSKTMVSLQGLPKQVYLVKVASGNQTTNFKLLKD